MALLGGAESGPCGRSGGYSKAASTWGWPRGPDCLLDVGHLLGGKVVEHNPLAGRQQGREGLFDITGKTSPVMGLSSTSGAVMPMLRSPAMRVTVCQWPCGAVSTRHLHQRPQP
jgi:hypothetical protein